MKHLILIAVLATAFAATAVRAGEDRVLEFPKDYRTKFIQYYSGDRLLADGQTITLYANAIARDGARKDGSLPDGSVLVAEIFAAVTDGEGEVIESTLGRRLPGAFKAIAVMERRAGWDDQYSEELKVGDWEFEIFSPAGENLGKDTTSCRECHHPLDDTEFLFSIEHLVAAQ